MDILRKEEKEKIKREIKRDIHIKKVEKTELRRKRSKKIFIFNVKKLKRGKDAK
jgi:hypothetical protein